MQNNIASYDYKSEVHPADKIKELEDKVKELQIELVTASCQYEEWTKERNRLREIIKMFPRVMSGCYPWVIQEPYTELEAKGIMFTVLDDFYDEFGHD